MAETSLRQAHRFPSISLERPSLFSWFAFLALMFVVALFFVWSRLQVIHFDYRICDLEGQLRQLQHRTQELQVEEATLSSSGRLERVARTQLGLQLPTPEQIIPIR